MRCLPSRLSPILLALATSILRAETTPIPWDLAKLDPAPAHRWLSQDAPVHSLLYSGETYQDKPTEVFAFYASPATLSGNKPPAGGFPAVVLIHGGGGTAFAEWTHLWAKRGYAAIAMDLSGSQPQAPTWIEHDGQKIPKPWGKNSTRARLPNGGPDHSHVEKFDCITTDTISDDWPYHAVASVIRAHSLIRSFPDVNPDRTAVTGISWGGYTTCIVASVDHRFKAAVPVYGCGFLHEGESVQKPSIDKLGDHRAKWITHYDPSNHLPNCRIPILFVNGTNDVHYVLDSYQKSFDRIPHDKKQMRITVKMPHGHQPGWAPNEIGLFIDSHCLPNTPVPGAQDNHTTTQPLPIPGKPIIKDSIIELPCTIANGTLTKAELHYTTDTGPRSKRNWTTVPATLTFASLTGSVSFTNGYTITAPKPPKEANTWFLTLTDSRNATVSTEIQFQ
jgi:dienelactone hydrolase